jgi:iron(III) transport system substrate-binding protein
LGTLLIPNSLALIKGGPNPTQGKKLIDYLLSAEVESLLAFGEAAQMPLRKGVKKPSYLPDISEIKAMQVDYSAVANNIEAATKFCQELFIRR